MKTFDKASWHIDGGENTLDVIARFRAVFTFLHEKKMLTTDGFETLEYAMDSSVSLNSSMVNADGMSFLEEYYDTSIRSDPATISDNLDKAYIEFMNKK